MRNFRSLQLLSLVLLLGMLGFAFPTFSSASFTARTQATGSVSAAADWTPPSVAVVSPGSTVKDIPTINVTATDGESAIASVTLEQLPPGGSDWTVVCTDTVAPYACAWDTRALVDGVHSLRARASDSAGYESTSEVVRTTVANKLFVVLASPGDAVRGTVPLTTTVYNAGSLTHTVRLEYAATGTTSWKTICTGLTSPYACSWNTASIVAGEYDLRAVLTAGATTTLSAVVDAVMVDNISPTVTMLDPGTPLSGNKTFTATASDANSGVSQVVIQSSLNGGTWTQLCTITQEPWSCRVATSSLPDGAYSFRAVATDAAGNSTVSVPTGTRSVDNTIASITVDAPASLTGTVSVGATASSTAGVASVRIQSAPTGTSTWTDLCTDTSAPYACTWNTTAVVDGLYDLRAVMTDAVGATTTSPVVSAQRVDNAPLRGVDVQSANGGSAIGRVEAGDTVTFTYSGQIDLTKVVAGWTGASKAVTVRLRDGSLLSKTATDDTLDVLSGTTAVNLGSLNLRQDYAKTGRTVQFNATMTAATVTTSGGVMRSTVTLRLGTFSSGSSSYLRTVSSVAAMIWSPSAAVTDLQGRACSIASVTETGTSDRDF
ncbi:fibronectin type III domain protein [Janibacter sp. HTCC2649]|uniref:Ig-like domain-containing protein n=1 Tax=Janibacter sp. HTCC2649 TaxID=313589 RepID=UPI00006718E0|nr:Ig-like domain-containing protein [Janibacter sp. HTCC2649]EAP98169.1 fibronectin type III domain protein [Janibacter sp. HTCC2649]